jgi:hypothetical protein
MSFSPIVDIKDGAQGPPGLGIVMQGDATVAEINLKDTNTISVGWAWTMLDAGTITTGTTPLAVDINDMIIWAAEGNWVKLVIEQGPMGEPGTPGVDGTDGFDPFIDVDNFWNDANGNTGVLATGPQGSPGESIRIVGNFGVVATPAELPADGLIPVDFDGPGRPAVAHQMETGDGLFYSHPEGPNNPEYGTVWVWYVEFGGWSNIGRIVGPEGPAGPQGPIGPDGIQGPPGETVAVVGYFGDVRTPGELPLDGFIPMDWDGPGRPSIDIQMENGWALFYQPVTGPEDPEYGQVWAYLEDTQQWTNIGRIAGPQGPAGPTGDPGPSVVSADPGNSAILGTDGYIWVPASSGGGEGSFEIGMIMPFHGATLPAGWNLCDGSNGTPNLADRFVMSSGPQFPAGTFAGNLPEGSTSGPSGGHSHTITITTGGAHGHSLTIDDAGSHSHNLSIASDGGHSHTLAIDPHVLGQGNMPQHNHGMFNSLSGNGANAPAVGNGQYGAVGFNDGGGGERYIVKNVSSAQGSNGTTSNVGSGSAVSHSGGTGSINAHSHAGSSAADGGSHGHTGAAASDAGHSHSGSGDTVDDHSHSIPAPTLPPYHSLVYMMYVGV